MKFEWNEQKRASNLLKHKLDFVDALNFFDSPSFIEIDCRYDYKEVRYSGMGMVFEREVVLIFTKPTEDRVRIISFRKANKREIRCYHEKIKNGLEGI